MSSPTFVCVVGACFAMTRAAHADDRGLAVLVGSSEGDPIVLKISDELRALGFEVEVAPQTTDRSDVRERAKSGGDAVLVVLVDEHEIVVRVVTSRQVHERSLSRRASDPGTNALAAVEVVRGYLVPVGDALKDDTIPAPPERPMSISMRLGVGFVSAGSFPSQATVTLGGAKHVGRLAIEVAGVAAIPRDDAWSGGVGVGLHFAPLGLTRPVSFTIGIGAMALAVAYKEDAKKYTTEATALPYLGVSVRAAITRSVFARADGMFGVAVPQLGFKSKTGDDIEFGSSVVAASAGMEVAW